MTKPIYMTAALSLLTASVSYAEDRFPSIRSEEFEWGLGAGVLVEDEGYAGLGYETNAQPVIYLSSKRFRYLGNQLDFQLVNNNRFMFGVKLEGRFDGFDADDGAIFAGMAEREGGWYGGFRTEWKTRYANFVGEAVKEVSGESDGAYGSLGAYWTFDQGERAQWVPKIAVEYYDSKYSEYYFGVPRVESSAARPAYTPGSAINIDVGVDYIFRFNSNHRIISSAKYRRYGSDIKDSPLVESSGSARFVFSYLYMF